MLQIIERNGIKSPMIKGYHIGDYFEDDNTVDDIEDFGNHTLLRTEIDLTYEQVAVIGDIHGTTKFIDGYMDILKNNNQVDKIIVMGDHFDPYDDIPFDVMVERYEEFIDCKNKDKRIISLLGNHDLATYVISDCTNRTERNGEKIEKLGELISSNLEDSYLIYRMGNYLFSHAGVSSAWIELVNKSFGYSFGELIEKGWDSKELDSLVRYYEFDFSGYGNNKNQGPTWIRPEMLTKYPFGKYNQVVGHTQFDKQSLKNGKNFPEMKMSNGKSLWMTDNGGNPEYLLLELNK